MTGIELIEKQPSITGKSKGEIFSAANCYIKQSHEDWPWDIKEFKLKPYNRISELIRAGSLYKQIEFFEMMNLCAKMIDQLITKQELFDKFYNS